MPQIYLGDGLYAEFNGLDLCIFASNGIERGDRVYLDLQMLEKLNNWINEKKEEKA